MYPEIEIETDDLKVFLTLKKDYRTCENPRVEIEKDLHDLVSEFCSSFEFNDLVEYYD